MSEFGSISEMLRALPVLASTPPRFDVSEVPEDPRLLLLDWLRAAVDAEVPEPHAMTLSTVDADGLPNGRVLILKDLDERGLWFATSASSTKGLELERQPDAALSFYWPSMGRSVRARGTTARGSARESAADFLARGVGAQAIALVGKQSQPLDDPAAVSVAVAGAISRLAAEPGLVAPDWSVYVLAPRQVEFWQADADRCHTRLRYARGVGGTWAHQLLWP